MSVLESFVPTRDRPDRAAVRLGLLLLLALDLILIAFLSKEHLVLLGVAVVVAAVLAAWNLPRALALVAVGYPLLDPIYLATREDWPAFYATRAILVVALLLTLVARTERPGWIVKRCLRDPIVLWALVFGAVLAAGLLWTPSPWYGHLKVMAYLMTNLALLGGGMVMALPHDPEDAAVRDGRIDRFLIAAIVCAVLIALVGLANWQLKFYRYEYRLLVLGINAIWLARTMGLAILAMFALSAYRRARPQVLLLAAAPIVAVLALSGSRGPIIALVCVTALWALVFHRTTPARRAWLLAGTCVAAALLFAAMPEAYRERFLNPVSRDLSGSIRLQLLRVVWKALSHVFGAGIGTGGFSDILRMGDVRMYPHNIFAEIGIENGIAGLIALGGFLVAAVARGMRHRADPRMLILLLAFFFALANAQVSGDITSNEWIWLFAGIMAGRAR